MWEGILRRIACRTCTHATALCNTSRLPQNNSASQLQRSRFPPGIHKLRLDCLFRTRLLRGFGHPFHVTALFVRKIIAVSSGLALSDCARRFTADTDILSVFLQVTTP